MSVAKLETVQKARKDQGTCRKCGVALPTGSQYRHFSFFRGGKYNYCMKPECTPKQSERESTKVAEIMAAQESLDFTGCETKDDVETVVHELAEIVRSVADEYAEAAVNPNTGEVFNTDAQERGEVLEGTADDLESWTYDEDEPQRDDYPEGDDGEIEYEEAHSDYMETAIEAAQQTCDEIEL